MSDPSSQDGSGAGPRPGGRGGGRGAGHRGRLWFCHSCSRSIREVTEDFHCSRCNSGFIEEFDTGRHYDETHDIEGVPPELPAILNAVFGGPAGHGGAGRGAGGHGGHGGPATFNFHFGGGGQGGPMAGGGGAAGGPGFFLQEILNNVAGMPIHAGQGPPPQMFQLYGNPGDYAWGRGGFDAIVTQLLNQMEGTGPPPLREDTIKNIPAVTISQSQVDSNLQCSVCWEDFKLNESVRQLNCDHLYHDPCIVPWLELHGTCPVCRQSQETENGGSSSHGGGSAEGSEGGATGGSAAAGARLGDTITSVFNNLFGGGESGSSGRDAGSRDSNQQEGSTAEQGQEGSRAGREEETGVRGQGSQRNRDGRGGSFQDFDLE